jgi:hypothetical protein
MYSLLFPELFSRFCPLEVKSSDPEAALKTEQEPGKELISAIQKEASGFDPQNPCTKPGVVAGAYLVNGRRNALFSS